MQTISIELEDALYDDLVEQGIDIKSKIKDFIYDLLDDGYPAISFEEAKKRVSEAVEEYESGKGIYYESNDEFWDNIEKRLIEKYS